MNRTEAEEFLKTHRQAVTSTMRKNGRPHLANIMVAYKDGRLLESLTRSRKRYSHLKNDPRATILVQGDSFWSPYIVVEGTATLIELPDARIPLREYYELASGGPHPDWEEYDQAMAKEQRLLASYSIDRVYPLTD